MTDARASLDARAVSLMIVLSILWGFNHVTAKLAAPGISLVMQASLRSLIAAALLLAWAAWRAIPMFERDRTLWPGFWAGVLFAFEFVFIFAGLAHTTVSRMIVFVYLAPALTALGLALMVPGEHLRPVQWAGVALGFVGVAIAFSEGFTGVDGRSTLLGDTFGILAGILWAATTVEIRATRLARASAAKTLFYQLAISAPILYATSLAMGEAGIVRLDALTLACLGFQSVVVAFASFLVWFWLLTKYLGGRLAVFSFLTPLFGVLSGWAVLGEPLTPRLIWGALAVGVGIVLVNRRG